MKRPVQFSIVLLIIFALSACVVINRNKFAKQKYFNNQQASSMTSTTEDQIKRTTNEDPSFIPLYSEFHMGPIVSDPAKPLTMKFPLKTRKIKSVPVKVYKVSKEHFIELLGQHSQPKHEGYLNIATFSKDERMPIFSGTQEVHEIGALPGDPLFKKSYIEIPMNIDGMEQYNQGYYYFEFEPAISSETSKPIDDQLMNSLLEITETISSYEDQYDHPIPHN